MNKLLNNQDNSHIYEQGIQRLYIHDRLNPNLFSKWYPHIKDCGLKVPKSTIIRVPEPVFIACYEPSLEPGNMEIITDWVNNQLVPLMGPDNNKYFCKNGAFSNKFDFNHCISDSSRILEDFIAIQYASLCLETGGVSEFVIREIIPTKKWKKTIYNGMPLRPEFRIFYDFTYQRPLYTANYWDYDYCCQGIYDAEDRKVFSEMKEILIEMYEAHKDRALNTTGNAMRDVHGLDSVWSIDLMLDDNEDFWLIDMAIGPSSAYYDLGKIKEAGGTSLLSQKEDLDETN